MTTVDVDSFSAAGVVEFTATGKAGLQTIVKFSRNFPKQPSVQLTPGNVNAAVNNMGYYVVATEGSFSIFAAFTAAKAPYHFYYTAVEVK